MICVSTVYVYICHYLPTVEYQIKDVLMLILDVEWDPRQSRLALCTGTNRLYMWSPAGSLSVEVPVEGVFNVHSLKWHPDGNTILLLGKDQMCVCYLSDLGAENT